MSMYGVAVANPFSLLDDEEAASVQLIAKASDAPVPAPEQPSKAVEPHKGGGRPAARGGRGGFRGAAPRNGPGNDKTGASEDRRPAKREFDRRSGTGRDAEMKRGGGGSYNWGTDSEQQSRKEPVVVAEVIAELPEVSERAEVKEVAEETPAEPEIIELDLAEYLKSQEALRVEEDTQLDIRRVEQDEGDQVLQQQEESDESGLLGAFSEKKKKSKKAVKKNVLSLEEFTKDSRRSGAAASAQRGGRGGSAPRGAGRGGARGGSSAPRGGPSRGPSSNDSFNGRRAMTSTVNIDDQSAFPSLALVK